MTEACVVWVTCSGPDEGESIASKLVTERLAACVNIVPGVRSVYEWEGKLETSAEVLLVIKTQKKHFDAVQNRVKELHSCACPEIVAIPIEQGSAEYLDWVVKNTTKAQD